MDVTLDFKYMQSTNSTVDKCLVPHSKKKWNMNLGSDPKFFCMECSGFLPQSKNIYGCLQASLLKHNCVLNEICLVKYR